MKIYVTSDHHFYHKNILKYEPIRPFKTIEEMNRELIKRWNEVVTDHDIVWHLGDFSFGNSAQTREIITSLNGIKFLIMGSHDHQTASWLKRYGFKEVYKHNIEDSNCILSHEPIIDCQKINVHGHIHSRDTGLDKTLYKNVSVEMTNFYPVLLSGLLEGK